MVAAAGGAVPGTRLVVRYAGDRGWDHERILLVKVSESSWLVYTPGNDLYEESMTDYSRVIVMSGGRRYPPDAGKVVAFSRPLEAGEVRELIETARREAAAQLGLAVTDVDVSGAIDWNGRPLAVLNLRLWRLLG